MGEIHLNSIDRDGTEEGFDLNLIVEVSKICNVPLIVGGGMGNLKHLNPILKLKNVNGLSISSALHYKRLEISQIKEYLKKHRNIRL